MKKTALLMATMLIVLAFIAGSVWAETFEYSAPVKYSQQKLADGSFLIVLDGPLSLSDGVLYVYHQDNMRGRSVRKQRIEPRVFTDNHKEWVIDPFTIKIGQVMFNLFSPQMVRWSGIPNCLVSLGDGLVFGDSYPDGRVKHDGTWDEPGGTGIVLVASGIPVQYPVDNSNCGEGKRITAPPATLKSIATTGSSKASGGNDQGAVVVAAPQGVAAAHNSAAATNQSAAANNSSVANTTSLINVNQVSGKGKKGGKNTAIVYAPNASQKVNNYNIRGNSADVKVYNNKPGKGGKGSGIKNVITYVGPSYQTIHFGVTGAETYDAYACAKCHSDSAKEDEQMKKLIYKNMSCMASGACTDKVPAPHKKGKK